MTTSPVVTITDELVAELEKECNEELSRGRSLLISGPIMAALLAERAELKQQSHAGAVTQDNLELFRKDAERYQWLCDGNGYFMEENSLCHVSNDKAEADAAIDQAMQEQQP